MHYNRINTFERQYLMNFILGSQLLNLSYYILNPIEHAKDKRKDQDGTSKLCGNNRDIYKKIIMHKFTIYKIFDILDFISKTKYFLKKKLKEYITFHKDKDRRWLEICHLNST